jgi:ribosomal protein L11 methyltransferase
MTYYELNITLVPPTPWSEIITAELAELGCDSFVETDSGVQAYGPVREVQLEKVKRLTILNNGIEGVQATLEINEIENQNWNARWEADFDPVFVEDRLAILAPFHAKELQKELTIYIEPKMSFGTGHHQTTWMMSKALMDRSHIPNNILDMGSGTGVLAILAEKLGGKNILAIDIEDWAYENALDNIERNACSQIEAKLGDVDLIEGYHFNLILANINKNVLKEQLPAYSQTLNLGGDLYLSGFFTSDVDDLVKLATNVNLNYVSHLTKDNWACIHLKKN